MDRIPLNEKPYTKIYRYMSSSSDLRDNNSES